MPNHKPHDTTEPAGSIHRRKFLAGSAVVAGGSVAVAATAARADDAETPNPVAAPPRPVVDARFPAEIGSGVFLIPDNRVFLVPNIGIIVGRDAALVVDCGLGLESAEAVLKTAQDLAPGREIILTSTHAHPEHSSGAQVFKTAGKVYYNKMQADYQARAGNPLLQVFKQGFLPPDQGDILDGLSLEDPTETYDGDSATIDLGGRIVELRNWGIAHSPDDQVITVPDAGIVFAGDLIEERSFPIIPYYPTDFGKSDIGLPRWNEALASIKAAAPKVIVPGHGALGGTEIADAVVDYIAYVQNLVQDANGVIDGLNVTVRDNYPTWENIGFIDPVLQFFES